MIALLLFLALVTPSLHLASGPPQLGGGRSVSDDLSEVRALVDKGDLPEAEALILELIARDEKDPAPRALLARVYLARAEKLRSSPLPDAGFAHMLELDALAALEKATELGSDDPTAWVDLAALFRDSGDLRKAREAAIRAEELSGDATAAWLLADLALRLKDVKEAIQWAQRGLAREPAHTELGMLLVESLERSGERESALEKLGEIARRCEGDELALRVWEIHGRNGNFDAARPFYETLCRTTPESAWYRFYLGSVKRRSGLYASALEDLELALESDPDSGHVLRERGLTLALMGRDEQAVDVLLDVVKREGPWREAVLLDLFEMARSLAERFLFELALECLDGILEIESHNFFGHVNRALVLRRAGRLEEADQAYVRAEELWGDDGAVLNDHGLVFWGQGHIEEARRYFERAAALSNADALENLAMLAWRSGELDDTRRWLERVLTVDPGREKARVFLERVARVPHRGE